MSNLKPIHLAFFLVFFSSLSAFGQWFPVSSGTTNNLNGAYLLGSGTGFVVGDAGTILKTTDAGATWTPLTSGTTTGFVAGQNSIFQPLVGTSTDGGASWTFQNFYFDGNEGGCTDVFFLDANTGVVSGVLFDGRGATARTTDGGTNWSTALYDQAIQGIDFPTTATGFAVGSGGRILHTTDAGTTWIDQTSGTSANLNGVSFAGDALTGIP